MKFYITFGLLCVAVYSFFTETERDNLKNRKMSSIYDDPVVTNWCDEGTFVVEELVKKIDETALGIIIVRRVDAGGGDLFSAIVDPAYIDIYVGSIVKIKNVEYVYYPYSTMSFMVAVKHSP